MAKIKVAQKSEVKEGQGKLVGINGKELALFNIKGEFFAIDNTCPHRGGPLAEGWLEENTVTCPLHGWQFDVKTGQNIMPGMSKLTSYKVLVEGARVAPLDALTEVLKDLKFPKGYKEKENLWVRLYGTRKGERKTPLMECIVNTILGWEDAGCNIDTGMPASIMAQMVKEKIIDEKGSFAPEAVVPSASFFKELKKRKMTIYENGKRIN